MTLRFGLGSAAHALALLALLDTLPVAAGVTHEARADSLVRRARIRWAEGSLAGRRTALADLEQASVLAPRREEIWLALASRSIEAGRFARGRACLSHAVKLAPSDSNAWIQLGGAWKRDWLFSLDRGSLDQALKCFRQVCAVAPNCSEGWTSLAALALLRGFTDEARAAALHAHRLAPDVAEPVRLLGAALFRGGNLTLADSAFRVAETLARKSPPEVRRAGAIAATPDEDVARSPPRFDWQGPDPDLTTPENEARLDYGTRLTLALFLFRDGDQVKWDKRAELFVRYGPPAAIDFNPAGASVGSQELSYRFTRHTFVRYAPDPIAFPYDEQVWSYPELGIQVALWDRSLGQSYELPYSNEAELDPRPDPGLVDARADLAAFDGGRSVFRAMAPGATPIQIEGAVARFPIAGRCHLLGDLFTDGAPGDSVWGSWALLDGSGQVVGRDSQALSPSVCDPAARQAGEFTVDVAPGDYRLDLSARASGGRRGIVHLRVHVDSLPAKLAMSDLVLLCGEPAAYAGPEGVRIEPDASGQAHRNSLTAYYELDQLALDRAGAARFAYTYSIHALRRGRERPAVFEATREEENIGTHRRQFMSIPIASLGPGEYRLRVEVRDLVAGATTVSTLSFVRPR